MTEASASGSSGGYAIDPEFTDLLALLPNGSFDDVQAARDGLNEMLTVLNADLDLSDLDVGDRIVPGPTDHQELAVRTYAPKTNASGAGLVFIHGGGFTVGNLESEHARAAGIARDSGAVVVSVDYRLAPEHPYPAGIEDCFAALRWLHESSGALGIDSTRIGVIGQSAGGGLAAGLALLARDRGGPALCFQHLGVPEIDDRLTTDSMQRFEDTPMWNRPAAASSWRMYLGAGVTSAPARSHRTRRRRGRQIFADCRRRTSRRWNSIHYATRASSTHADCSQLGCPASCTSFPAPSTDPRRWWRRLR